jgi:hypothetical protein
MKQVLTVLAGLSLLSACVVTLPHILKTDPVRTASFKGSHADVAGCVRLLAGGGKVQRAPGGARIDIYNARKVWTSIGVTHYAVSLYQDGNIELRKLPSGDLTPAAAEKLWNPIEDCIRRTTGG